MADPPEIPAAVKAAEAIHEATEQSCAVPRVRKNFVTRIAAIIAREMAPAKAKAVELAYREGLAKGWGIERDTLEDYTRAGEATLCWLCSKARAALAQPKEASP